ncbi:MAG TPA: hypothetical protein DFR83_06970, partial [Deltaproteobacteria bacterium]|nr:hypothetical protein [Deltaproteobacteria bacterium]
EDETLADLGIVNHELLYLLPEPPAGSGVQEQVPQYPENRGYAGKGLGAVAMSLLILLVWAVMWGFALTVERSTWAVAIPGGATGLFSISLSRHMLGGQGSQPRIVGLAIPIFLSAFMLVFLPTIGTMGMDGLALVYRETISGFATGLAGILFGWLAWWGSVEALPAVEKKIEVKAEQVVTANCGICQGAVTPDVRKDCPHGCGHVFHTGCHQARLAVYRGDARFCAVCNIQVA